MQNHSTDRDRYHKKEMIQMALDDLHSVDAIGFERSSGSTVLSIFDHWDWIDIQFHWNALKEKIDRYFNFIESGQLLEEYPLAIGSPVKIKIFFRHKEPEIIRDLIIEVDKIASDLSTEVLIGELR